MCLLGWRGKTSTALFLAFALLSDGCLSKEPMLASESWQKTVSGPAPNTSQTYSSGPLAALTLGDFAQILNTLQVGLSGQQYAPPDDSTSDDDDNDQPAAPTNHPAANCLPNPPQCSAAGDRGKNYIANASDRLRSIAAPGAGMAGMMAYCVNQVQAEIARVCANEYARNGLPTCADLARQQMNANLRVADGARATVVAYTTGSWREDCGW